MDNPDVEIAQTLAFGKGLRALKAIPRGTVIADWNGGQVYKAEKCTDLPKDIADHAIQFGEHCWIDTKGIGRYANHSCEPNCGIKGKFQLVAMRDIAKGEWLTFDYEMTEDSDFRVNCQCGTKSCRKTIGAFRNLPNNARKKYKGFVSEWLVRKYNL